KRRLVLPDLGHLLEESEIANVGLAAGQAFAVNPHQVAVGVIIDHRLIGLPLFIAAQEQAAVGAEVVFHFQDDLEVAVFVIGDDDAAVAGDVLAAVDGAVLDEPFAAGLVLARPAMTSLCADVPALERLAVENGDVAVLLLFVRPWSGRGYERD